MSTVTQQRQAGQRLLSEQLEDLRTLFAERAVTLRDLVLALEGRAYTLLIVLFALPFVLPVSVPGSSTILGGIIAVIAAQLAANRLPWLPKRLLERPLPKGFFQRVIPVTARLVRFIERVLHPRWPNWTGARPKVVHLLTIVAAGFLLALPIVVPFTNMFPGWVILLLACGLLERDGVFVLIGYAVFLFTLLYFAPIGAAATEGLIHLWRWLGW